MKLYDALKIFEIKDNSQTKEQIKSLFKKLALQNHPDKGGSTEIMQKIIEAYECIKENYTFVINSDEKKQEFENTANFWDINDEDMKKAYLSIYLLDGLIIEVCGFWMWVTGNTFAHKKELRQAGLYYASKKQAWYWKPEDYICVSNGKTSLDEIRKSYGSKLINNDTKFIKGE